MTATLLCSGAEPSVKLFTGEGGSSASADATTEPARDKAAVHEVVQGTMVWLCTAHPVPPPHTRCVHSRGLSEPDAPFTAVIKLTKKEPACGRAHTHTSKSSSSTQAHVGEPDTQHCKGGCPRCKGGCARRGAARVPGCAAQGWLPGRRPVAAVRSTHAHTHFAAVRSTHTHIRMHTHTHAHKTRTHTCSHTARTHVHTHAHNSRQGFVSTSVSAPYHSLKELSNRNASSPPPPREPSPQPASAVLVAMVFIRQPRPPVPTRAHNPVEGRKTRT
jgi:hypothetical protein